MLKIFSKILRRKGDYLPRDPEFDEKQYDPKVRKFDNMPKESRRQMIKRLYDLETQWSILQNRMDSQGQIPVYEDKLKAKLFDVEYQFKELLTFLYDALTFTFSWWLSAHRDYSGVAMQDFRDQADKLFAQKYQGPALMTPEIAKQFQQQNPLFTLDPYNDLDVNQTANNLVNIWRQHYGKPYDQKPQEWHDLFGYPREELNVFYGGKKWETVWGKAYEAFQKLKANRGGSVNQKMMTFNWALSVCHNNGPMADHFIGERGRGQQFLTELSNSNLWEKNKYRLERTTKRKKICGRT